MLSTKNPKALGSAALAAKGNRYNFIVVFFAALGSFAYGFNSAIVGAVFGLHSFFDYFDIALDGPHANQGNQYIGGRHNQSNRSQSVHHELTM